MGEVANGRLRSGLFRAAALLALTYTGAIFVALPFPLEAIWKASGIALFAAYAFSRNARLAGAALLFSAAGDIALALPTPNFIAGMAFFGAAHVLYLAAFILLIRRDGASRLAPPLIAFIVAASVGLLFWFLPGMGALKVPGFAYQSIITAMAAAALASRAPLTAKLGAVVFMLSDTLIALGLYKGVAAPPGSVWMSYVAAQALLAQGPADARVLKTPDMT